MYTLKHLILGNVIDVIQSMRSNRVYLVLNPGNLESGSHFMLPLLCPVCGEPWHFVWNNPEHELASALKKSMEGFQLVEAKYIAHSSAENIAEAMEKFSLGSVPSELIIENAADHINEHGIFPIVALSFEKRTSSPFPTADELRAMSPNEVRNELDLDEHENIDKAIHEVEKWMESEYYDDFEVEDDIFLAIHPNAFLETIMVEPEIGPRGNDVYPYQLILSLVDDLEIGKNGDANNSES